MEALYKMGLEIHYVGIVVLGAVVIFNLMMLALAKQVTRYAKRMRIVMPISASLIAVTIFTGAVMMAAKHLQFTFSNIAMILISIAFIIIEAKRYKILKRGTDIMAEGAFELYKAKAFRMLGIEMVLIVLMSIWMQV